MTHVIGNSGTLLKELWKVGPEIPNSWNNKLASANLFLCYSADTRCKNTRFRDHCSQTWLCTHPRIGRTGTWVKKEQSDVGNMAKEQWLFYLKISNSMVSSLHADFPLCSEPWMILVCELVLPLVFYPLTPPSPVPCHCALCRCWILDKCRNPDNSQSHLIKVCIFISFHIHGCVYLVLTRTSSLTRTFCW